MRARLRGMTRPKTKPTPSTLAFRAARIEPALAAAMDKLTKRDGINTSEIIRRALQAFLIEKDVLKEKRQK
jgi:hypothetical protein